MVRSRFDLSRSRFEGGRVNGVFLATQLTLPALDGAGQAPRERRLQRAARQRARGHARARSRHGLPVQRRQAPRRGRPRGGPATRSTSTASSTRSTSRRGQADPPRRPAPPLPPRRRPPAPARRPKPATPSPPSPPRRRPSADKIGSMLEERPSFFTRLLRGLDGLRRFLVNVLFFGLLAGLVIASLGGRPKVPDGAALVLNPRGTIVEQLARVDPIERFVARSTRRGRRGAARRCSRTSSTRCGSRRTTRASRPSTSTRTTWPAAGFTKLRDLRAAIADFKKSGKKVIAYGDDYMQSQYYLAAQADEVYLHPEGMVLLEGFGRPAQLLQGRPRPLRDRDARLPRGRVQVGGRAVPAQRHVQGSARDVARHLRRPVARLPRRRGRGAQDHARRASRR